MKRINSFLMLKPTTKIFKDLQNILLGLPALDPWNTMNCFIKEQDIPRELNF